MSNSKTKQPLVSRLSTEVHRIATGKLDHGEPRGCSCFLLSPIPGLTIRWPRHRWYAKSWYWAGGHWWAFKAAVWSTTGHLLTAVARALDITGLGAGIYELVCG